MVQIRGHHQSSFACLGRRRVINKNSGLNFHNPLPEVDRKSRYVPAPVDMTFAHSQSLLTRPKRDPRTILVDMRQGDVKLLTEALNLLTTRDEHFALITVGSEEILVPGVVNHAIREKDVVGQAQACHEAGIYLSVRPGAAFDEMMVRSLGMGAWPVVPEDGAYPELLPPELHGLCLYGAAPELLVARILQAWHVDRSKLQYQEEMTELLKQFDGPRASKVIDQRLEALAAKEPAADSPRRAHPQPPSAAKFTPIWIVRLGPRRVGLWFVGPGWAGLWPNSPGCQVELSRVAIRPGQFVVTFGEAVTLGVGVDNALDEDFAAGGSDADRVGDFDFNHLPVSEQTAGKLDALAALRQIVRRCADGDINRLAGVDAIFVAHVADACPTIS